MSCSFMIPAARPGDLSRPVAIELGIDPGFMASHTGLLPVSAEADADPSDIALRHISAVGASIIYVSSLQYPDYKSISSQVQQKFCTPYAAAGNTQALIDQVCTNMQLQPKFRKAVETGAMLMRLASEVNHAAPSSINRLTLSSLEESNGTRTTELTTQTCRDHELSIWNLAMTSSYIGHGTLHTRVDTTHLTGSGDCLAYRPAISVAFACRSMVELLTA